MKAIKAHVHNGQIVLDEPVDLPDGIAVEVLLPENDELTTDQQTELESAIEESAAEFAAGDIVDARSFAARLVAKT